MPQYPYYLVEYPYYPVQYPYYPVQYPYYPVQHPYYPVEYPYHMMAHSSTCGPHQQYVLYVSYHSMMYGVYACGTGVSVSSASNWSQKREKRMMHIIFL